MDCKVETYKIRIEGAQEAIKRARLVFMILTIASLAIVIGVWNTYFSWERDFAFSQTFPSIDSQVTDYVQKQLLAEWVKTGTIGISLLGISVRVSDASLLGSLCIFILSVWLFFCARRENHAVGGLLMESRTEDAELRRMIFHGVCSSLVFITVGPDDDPISSLKTNPPGPHRILLRHVVRALFFIGPFSVFLVLFADLGTLFFIKAAARWPHYAIASLPSGTVPVSSWWKLGVMETVGFGLGISSAFIAWQVLRFEKGTTFILREYGRLLAPGSIDNSPGDV